MTDGITRSERFVTKLCKNTFLSMWTHPNPIGRNGKELCDCLIVCGDHIIIISVKEIQYKDTGNYTGRDRWIKKAIEKSASQIAGAEKWLERANEVKRRDGRKITLPPLSDRKLHRISVSLGSKGKVPLKWGELGKGFVHVCDEYSLLAVFKGLDTITDFTHYLDETESLMKSDTEIRFDGGGIEDLVALYLQQQRSFDCFDENDERPDLVYLSGDLWSSLVDSESFKDYLKDVEQSSFWDRMIEHYAGTTISGDMFEMLSEETTDNDSAIVAMALEPRLNRIRLSKAYREFLQNPALKISARVTTGRDGFAYVFTLGGSDDRESRSAELGVRCFIVRNNMPNIHTVIGIAMDRPGASKVGYSSDIAYMHLPEWSAEQKKQTDAMQKLSGFFSGMKWTKTN